MHSHSSLSFFTPSMLADLYAVMAPVIGPSGMHDSRVNNLQAFVIVNNSSFDLKIW